MKIFYLHIPKTAGSSINTFFSSNVEKSLVHIESLNKLNKETLENYDYVAGHITFNKFSDLVKNINSWTLISTFREPVSYVVSHLKWVRKLAEPGEEKRLKMHPEIFQKIALEMTNYDFSNPNQINDFIKWLEKINFYYFHNTQLYYLNQKIDQKRVTFDNIEQAIKNLNKIDFIGIQEELDIFLKIISSKFNWIYKEMPIVNVNNKNFGFDINNKDIVAALEPLYNKDRIIYNEAKKIFEKTKEEYLKNKKVRNIIGYVDNIKSNIVSGWAMDKNSLDNLDISLYVNNKLIMKTKNNLFRKDLKEKNIHPDRKSVV